MVHGWLHSQVPNSLNGSFSYKEVALVIICLTILMKMHVKAVFRIACCSHWLWPSASLEVTSTRGAPEIIWHYFLALLSVTL